jgi:GH25 family lysozyme M1 (1,4-beta-N-acetylmuramidase)
MEIKAIDVSSDQGKPDWEKVAKSGIKVAILRVHQRYGADSSFEHNYKGCKQNGILAGAYKYSYALTPAQAVEEAENVIEVLNGRGLDFPVFYDLEWKQQRSLGKQAIENIAVSFLTRIKKAGYKVGIYCNMDWYNNYLSDNLKKYDLWLARYANNDNGTIPERLRPSVGIGWQYSESGKVAGINAKDVDMDVFYTDYRTEKKEEGTVSKTKLQKFTELGDYYASNGGYLEKKSNAYLDDFQKNAGYNNYTKFARDVDNWGQPGCQAQPWCAEYQFWKLVKVLGLARALQIMGGGFYNCKNVTAHAKQKGTWHSTPKKGALIIFRNGSHIGSINSFDSTYVYTNEGNTSSAAGVVANGGACRNKKYKLTDSAIDGYVWIDYGTTADQKSTETAVQLSKTPKWVGKVTAVELNVRSWPGTENPKIKKWPLLKKNNLIDVCDTIKASDNTDWYYIRIAGKYYGFVSATFIRRV